MRSIRIFLVVVVIATMVLTVFLSSLHGYRSSMAAIRQLLDSELADRVLILSTVVEQHAAHNPVTQVSDQYAFQVWQGGKLLLRSSNTPEAAISRFEPGYRDINFGGHRWRSYSYHDSASDRWTVAAEQLDTRNALAERIILKSVLPVVTILPVTGLLIWFVVGYGLSPLRQLARHLRNRRADDLAPVPLEQQPVELMQLVTSTNDLLRRLQASFSREKRFAADAAHELRTPISALKVHLYNIGEKMPSTDHDLQQLIFATRRMANLVEQILSLYRTAPDQYMARFRKVDLYSIIQEVILIIYDDFEDKDLQLELHGDTAIIEGDHFALETLVHNLVDNACKYTPRGGRVEITIREDSSGVTFQVEDSGPGIPEDERQRVFDRFYRQGGDQHESEVIGCGLGLAIVRHIAELHGASVTLGASRFDSGLMVSVFFPHATILASPGDST